MMKLKKGDKVMALAGRDRGKSGQVLHTLPRRQEVLVEGLNISKRHTKPSQTNPRGGILEITKPLPAAKVALVCPHCGKTTRVGWQVTDKAKERVCKKCGEVLKT